MHRYTSCSCRTPLIFCRCLDRENRLRGTELSWKWRWRGPGYQRVFVSLKWRRRLRLAMKNPRENDRSGRRPDTNCGEHSGNTRGSSAKRSSEPAWFIAYRWLPRPVDWLTRRTPVRCDTRVLPSIYDWRCPASMTPNIVDNPVDIADRLLIGNEIEQELLADGLLAQCLEDACLAITYV